MIKPTKVWLTDGPQAGRYHNGVAVGDMIPVPRPFDECGNGVALVDWYRRTGNTDGVYGWPEYRFHSTEEAP